MKAKRVLSLALAVTLCLGLLVIPAGAAGVTVTEVVPCKYEEVKDFSEGMAAVKIDTGKKNEYGLPIMKWGFINKAGKETVPCRYDQVEDFSNGLAAVKSGGKWGFVDTTGREVVPYQYDYAYDFNQGLAVVKTDEQGIGFIDTTGKEVVPCKYSGFGHISEGMAAVELNGKWGFIDNTGKEVIPPQYAWVSNFSEGLAAVQLNGKFGYIDKAGKLVIPCKYAHAYAFSQGLAAVKLNGKYGYIDKAGKTVLPHKYDSIIFNLSPKGPAAVMIDDQGIGLVDKTGKEIAPCKYSNIWAFSDGLGRVALSGKYGFVDTTGQEVVPCKYGKANDFSDGLAEVSLPGEYDPEKGYTLFKWGYIDKTGKEIVPPGKYYNIEPFSEGLAEVCSWDNHRGYIDTTGKEVIPCKYRSASAFSDGVAVVADGNNQWGLIDKTGQEVVPFGKYSSISAATEGFIAVRISDKVEQRFKWGFLSVKTAVVSTGILPEKSGTAHQNTQTISVDGKAVKFDTYALSNANGGITNYVKLRDLADVLDGTAAQFNVGWSKEKGVFVETGKPYTTRNGQEGKTPYTGNRAYVKGEPTTLVDGVAIELQAFVLTDDNGGSSTYYQFRDLAQALGFNVGWTGDRGVFIETDKPYDPNN